MGVKVKIKLGLIAAIIATIYYSMGTIGMLMLTCFIPKERLIFGMFFLLHLIPLIICFLYIISLVKKKLSSAKVSFYILSGCIIFSAIAFIFQGLFVKETSEGLISYTTLLALIVSIPVFLFLFCLGMGLNGLKKYLSEQQSQAI